MKVCAAGLLTKPWDCQASSPSAVPRGPLVLLTPQQGTAHPLLPGGYRALAKALLRVVGTGTVPIAHHLQPQTPPSIPTARAPSLQTPYCQPEPCLPALRATCGLSTFMAPLVLMSLTRLGPAALTSTAIPHQDEVNY